MKVLVTFALCSIFVTLVETINISLLETVIFADFRQLEKAELVLRLHKRHLNSQMDYN